MPPSRPLELVAVADAPTPPARPEGLTRVAALATRDRADANAKPAGAKSDAISGPSVAAAGNPQLARAASLPVVITQGPKDRASVPSEVLAYADGAPQAPRLPAPGKDAGDPQGTTIVPARLDHSNFPSLTGDVATASAPTPSVLGQALTGLRQAARIIPDALSNLPTAGFMSAFKAVASELDSAHFSSPAAKPAASSVSIAEASTPRKN
jgi:hypothetical protein